MKNPVKINLLGDIHGNLSVFDEALSCLRDDELLFQIGDFGFGFVNVPPIYPTNVLILRGNHDSPQLFQEHPNSLNDFGFIEELNLFYVGGAYSIDKYRRVEGKNWWSNEELNYSQSLQCLELYEAVKKDVCIVITHAAPQQLVRRWWSWDGDSHTEILLQNILEIQAPEYWYFGHYHLSRQELINNCQFRSLGINEIVSFST